MPKLSTFEKSRVVKMLLIGDSGSGKTGALAALVKAGYKLLIIDFDNGLDYLVEDLKKNAPELLDNVYFETFKDKVKLVGDEMVSAGTPKAYSGSMKILDKGIEDIGSPWHLDSSWIVVVDSLSLAGHAALLHHKFMSPSKDPRQNYAGAQQMIMGLINNLTSDDFGPNVIVSTHISMVEIENGIMKGLPTAIGKAIAGEIPKYFNTMLEVRQSGSGENVKRVISTVPSTLVPVKAPLPKGLLEKSLPIETGLATFFEKFGVKSPKEEKKSA